MENLGESFYALLLDVWASYAHFSQGNYFLTSTVLTTSNPLALTGMGQSLPSDDH